MFEHDSITEADTETAGRRRTLLRAFGGRGHDVYLPEAWTSPVVFASPHSGGIYPDLLLRASPLTRRELRRNEDAFVDRLVACAPEFGSPMVSARFPRCFVDVNRAGDDLPPEWREPCASGLETGARDAGASPTAAYRARMGLGVVPLVISENLSIYRHPPSREAVKARIEALYTPYHDTLHTLLHRARDAWGEALLVDCHSMPGFAAEVRGGRGRPNRRADIVLGDAHGRAAAGSVTDLLHRAWERRGYHVVRNHPYAGGHATLHYGRPGEGLHAVQVEINRDLYLHPVTLAPKPGFERLKRDMRTIVEEVTDAMRPGAALAAE